MNNEFFNIEINPDKVTVTRIANPDDVHGMNWCIGSESWGGIHCGISSTCDPNSPETTLPEKGISLLPALGFKLSNKGKTSVY